MMDSISHNPKVTATDNQIKCEVMPLSKMLKSRNYYEFIELYSRRDIDPHALFKTIVGKVEDREILWHE